MSSICNHRWWAPRIEVPDSVPVLHVCLEPAGVDEHPPGDGLVRRLHRCSCGATLGGDGGAYGHAGSSRSSYWTYRGGYERWPDLACPVTGVACVLRCGVEGCARLRG